MATRGFEFAYDIQGAQATPKIMDWPIASYMTGYPGDALTITSDGYGTAVGTATKEVLGILQETVTSAAAAANYKVAIACREQVWRCSMDSTSTTAKVGYTKSVQFVDGNTIDTHFTAGTGSMILVDTGTDDEGNVLAYVCFSDTTFGNT